MTLKRINWIDTARAVSIILVVILHARNELLLFSIHSPTVNRFVEISATFRMPLFFAVAGLLARKWIHARWTDLLRSKISLLVWVLVVWQPIVLLYKLVNHLVLGTFNGAVLAQEVLRAALAFLRPNGELWFLWTLGLFFLFGRLSSKVSAAKQIAIATSVAFFWMSVVEPLLPELIFRALGSGWNGLFRYYFLFIGFALLSRPITTLVSKMKWHVASAVLLTSVIAAIVVAYFELPSAATSFPLTLITVMGGLALARLIQDCALFQYLGRHTLEIYLAHTTIIALATCSAVVIGLTAALEFYAIATILSLTLLAIACSLAVSRCKWTKYMYQQPNWFSSKLASCQLAREKIRTY